MDDATAMSRAAMAIDVVMLRVVADGRTTRARNNRCLPR